MFRRRQFPKTLAMAILALAAISQTARAGDLSAQQIIDGLKAPRTRSLAGDSQPAALSPDDAAFINRVRTRSLSSADRDEPLSTADRDRLETIAQQRPSVNVEVYFDFDSAALTPQAQPQLDKLGQALTSQDLAGSVVMLGGHTDAKGGDDYNQGLSERRAATVKKFLIENYHVAPENLISSGYGKKDLKNPSDPFAAENRRVQIVNMASGNQASN